MKILITTDVIHAGGAETFVLRLAQALHAKGHEVYLYILYKNRIDYKVARAIAPDVQVYPARLRAIRQLQRLDGLLLKLRIDFSVIDRLLKKDLESFLERHRIDVVHSHLFTADYVCVLATEKSNLPVVTTMHGDYALYVKKLKRGEPVRIVNFFGKLQQVLRKLKGIACISDEQLQFFAEEITEPKALPLTKIYNGYAVAPTDTTVSRAALNIAPEGFVFGMVARGIPEKGWQVAIDAFNLAAIPDAWLLFVGDSPYVQELKRQYADHPRIIFAGYSSNPVEYIRLFDAGLFASTYYAESLPTVLIEYLACGKPVVSCAIAECSQMLEADGAKAGLLVALEEGKVPADKLAAAMAEIRRNPDLYRQLQQRTAAAFKKFDMQECVSRYEAIYERSIHQA